MVNLLKVLIPLMIIIELLMVYQIMEKVAVKLAPLSKMMGMKKETIFPLLVGVIMGVTYGAGTLIEMNKKTPISKKDLMLMGVFIYLCHGIIETGLLFGVAGASIIVVTFVRLLIAFAVTVILSKTPYFRKMDTEDLTGNEA
nr:nucleoside recognition domain-containing protein [Clostridium aminobutyricum]